MPIVEASEIIDAPKDRLFALAQDYYVRLEWDPFLSSMEFLGGAREAAVGVRVQVRSKRGLTMEVEYTTLEPPDRVAVVMVKGPFFFESFAGAWRFEAITPEQTEVRFRYSFKTRWPLMRLVADPLISAVFLHDIRARLRGLKQAAETTDIFERVGKAAT
jgi:ribosome-associated toxin RatA of RatAB toxin-antitoxin module